jgi:uncharacterized protein YutE (UPF0331/DUF86 family)
VDWKEFIALLIGNIAWPVSILCVVLVFRSEIGRLVEKLAHFKYGDLELEFDKVRERARAIQGEVRQATDKRGENGPVFTSLEDQILDTAEKTPGAAIVLAWSALEAAIASTVLRMGISPESPSYRSPLHNIEMLERFGGLTKGYGSLLDEMRILRNKVAHHHDAMMSVSQDQAMSYAKAAIEMIQYLNRMQRVDGDTRLSLKGEIGGCP